VEPHFFCIHAICPDAGLWEQFLFGGADVNSNSMNWGGLTESFEQIWERKPKLLLVLLFGFIVFLFIVADAWVHKRRRKRGPKHPH
jgi:hypothetical protein